MLVELDYQPSTGALCTKEGMLIISVAINSPELINSKVVAKCTSLKPSTYTVAELVELKKVGFTADEIVTMQQSKHHE